jgi:hypothetical protein
MDSPESGGKEMFCPECRSEYVESVTKCPDCSVALVDKLPPENEEDAHEDPANYLPLVRTFSAKDIALIHSVLGGTNIRYFIQGENFTHVRPMADPAVLLIAEEDLNDARELLKDLPLSFYPWAPDGGHSPEDEKKDKDPGNK